MHVHILKYLLATIRIFNHFEHYHPLVDIYETQDFYLKKNVHKEESKLVPVW